MENLVQQIKFYKEYFFENKVFLFWETNPFVLKNEFGIFRIV